MIKINYIKIYSHWLKRGCSDPDPTQYIKTKRKHAASQLHQEEEYIKGNVCFVKYPRHHGT